MIGFRDRRDAGRRLAELLESYREASPTILALPRGGVPVAFEIARALDAPLDVFVVRKLGVPGQEELAMGAIASGDVIVMNDDIVRDLGITQAQIDAVIEQESREIRRRETLYRSGVPVAPIRGRTVIVVDDGMATGASMHVAIDALRMLAPKEIVVAVPVATREALIMARRHVDDWACVLVPEPFYGVGMWYRDFSQVSDAEVSSLLAQASSLVHSG